MARRTKEQIQHDNYCLEVDKYKYFLYNKDNGSIYTGFEYKEDAVELLEDYQDEDNTTVIYTKSHLKKLGVDIDAKLNDWKQ